MARSRFWLVGAVCCLGAVPLAHWSLAGQTPPPVAPAAPAAERTLDKQTKEEALAKSTGCLTCHQGIEPMHDENLNVNLGCADCHGGDPCATTKDAAHVHPSYPEVWKGLSRNPERSFTILNKENKPFVRFVNPGDWRVVHLTCGTAGCHAEEARVNQKNIMGHSMMVPGSAAYNNGALNIKIYGVGESYAPDGKPRRLYSTPTPTPEETKRKGVVAYMDPVPRWEISQPGNVFRIIEINNNATSARGVGTDFRIDAGILNIQKTKLNDPTMGFLGTNDHCGDYRSSGCTSCHVVYANDRDKGHSAQYAEFGNRGYYAGNDPTLPKNESGHPIKHTLTKGMPSSQCVTCHFHQGSGALTNYYGYMWWDYESGMEEIYPRYGPPAISGGMGYKNYLGGAQGGAKIDTHDLAPTVNPNLHGVNFADFHNAGWLMAAVYKRDLHGNLIDDKNQLIAKDDPNWHKKAIHLKDIHLEKGMHCIDCHFKKDNHGDGQLYNAMVDEVEVACKDCHGTVRERATFKTSNPAAPVGGTDFGRDQTKFNGRRIQVRGGKAYQQSAVTKGLEWPVKQIIDTITPGNPDYNEQSRLAKTMHRDGVTWGVPPKDDKHLAHSDSTMTCYACHSSWNTQCSGCHLDARTNLRTVNLHYEGEESKVYAAYTPEVNRSDGFMLGINGTVQGNKVSPVRSASGVIASAADGNRAMVVHQQPTIAAEGHSGHAMTPNPPHTVSIKETRKCTECHVAAANNNNSLISKLYGLGNRGVDMIGRYAWVAERGKGFEAVRVTSNDDFPQPVIGSDLQPYVDKLAWDFHQKNGGILCEAYGHKSHDARAIQKYGEWMLIADGPGGFRVFDIANIANKNVAQRIVESPISPLGQSLRVRSKDATGIGLCSVLPVDTQRSMKPENEEIPLHPAYGYAFVSDFYEGLIVINIHTLVDSNPSNNFLRRDLTFNPDGILNGAVTIRMAGTKAYILCEAGLVVVDVSKPLCPRVVTVLGAPSLVKPRAIEFQFRYAFVCDCEGLKIVDITIPEAPFVAATIPMRDARDVRLCRTYAYVAAGADGVAIIDMESPTKPGQLQFFNAGGCINDATAVMPTAAYSSMYLYVADGRNGLRSIQLFSPKDGDDAQGFSPVPKPKLIASYPTKGPAVALSEGMPRDRYIDEEGIIFTVFGRRGSHGFQTDLLKRMYLRNGQLYTVTDAPPAKPKEPPTKEDADKSTAATGPK